MIIDGMKRRNTIFMRHFRQIFILLQIGIAQKSKEVLSGLKY